MRALRALLTILAAVLAFPAFAGEGSRSLFDSELTLSIPDPIRNFVVRYLDEARGMTAPERGRKMEFDEVEVTFPLNDEGFRSLKGADQVIFSLNSGRTYEILWMKNDRLLGLMAFPASYNLINFKDQEGSFRELKERFSEGAANPPAIDFTGISDFKPENVACKPGSVFVWGYLSTDTYVDMPSKRYVWGSSMPKESLVNLVVEGPQTGEAAVDLTMVGYDREEYSARMPFGVFDSVLRDGGSRAYCGISEIEDDGTIVAVALYHNPLYAYVHSVELRLEPDQQRELVPVIKARLLPYVKLHNLKSLWGEEEK